MKKILFFARLPLSDKEVMDGEIQRVLILDDMAKNEKFDRTYVHLKFNSLSNKIYNPKILKGVKAYSLSIFRIKTWYLLKSLIISHNISYFHSLHNYKFAFLFNHWLKNTLSVIDFHGVVPEENFFLGNTVRGYIYELIEKFNIRFFDAYVCVSKSMIIFYQKKYQLTNKSFHMLPMVRTDQNQFESTSINLYKNKFNIPLEIPIAIYAGNCQKWQNIDLMMDCINDIKSEVFFIILSAQVEEFKEIIRQKKITKDILLRSVEPKELFQFYTIANYGFLLRDDNPVNNVANPTKLVEYLQYGIVPIILSKNTSDIDIMNVDTIFLKDFKEDNYSNQKNIHNINIYQQYYNSNNYKLSNIVKDD